MTGLKGHLANTFSVDAHVVSQMNTSDLENSDV